MMEEEPPAPRATQPPLERGWSSSPSWIVELSVENPHAGPLGVQLEISAGRPHDDPPPVSPQLPARLIIHLAAVAQHLVNGKLRAAPPKRANTPARPQGYADRLTDELMQSAPPFTAR